MSTETRIMLKRAYQPPHDDDGCRVLVDRIWPRGIKKADLTIDHWLKELAPSSELRKWFGHRTDRWQEFQRRYRRELDDRPAEIDRLRALLHAGPVTLVYAARDEDHNNAVALRDYLDKR